MEAGQHYAVVSKPSVPEDIDQPIASNGWGNLYSLDTGLDRTNRTDQTAPAPSEWKLAHQHQ